MRAYVPTCICAHVGMHDRVCAHVCVHMSVQMYMHISVQRFERHAIPLYRSTDQQRMDKKGRLLQKARWSQVTS